MLTEGYFEALAERYRALAVHGTGYPAPQGSPLLELVTSIGILYLFNPIAVLQKQKKMDVLINASLEQLLPEDSQSSSVQALEGGRWIFAGSLREQLEPGLFLFDAGVPLLLFTDQEPPLTRSVRVVTAPPLFGIPLAG